MKLTPKQAADRTGVSVSLIYLWCDQRLLSHFRFGGMGRRGKILIEESELDAFMDKMRVEAEIPSEPTITAPKTKPGVAAFGNLNSDRLLAAWRREGVLSDPPGEDSVR